MEIELCGYKVLIDDEDYEKIIKYNWYITKPNGKTFVYFSRMVSDISKRYNISLHRYIMGAQLYDKNIIDHINGNTLDNRKCNLRICTSFGNNCNSRKQKNNKSGYKGVSYYKRNNKYVATIGYKNKTLFLGYYDNPLDAHAAYCEASKKYHGEYGRTE